MLNIFKQFVTARKQVFIIIILQLYLLHKVTKLLLELG